jgi:hypothetical protein
VKPTQTQFPLPGVPRAKQGREVPSHWAWTEASGWTERLLATLERGVKGGKWYSLMDKVWKLGNLESALGKVVGNKGAAGVDGQSAAQYLRESPKRLLQVQACKRHKLQGRARGRDHQRWPNAYFTRLGLISLASARSHVSRPPL